MRRALAPALLFAALLLSRPASAAHWDFIYTDRFDLTLCTNGCGITLAGTGYALLVNKGAADITASQLFSATYTATSSQPSVHITPFINNPGPPVAPIHPNEAVGSVSPFANDTVLLTQLLPGETLRNTYDFQLFAFQIDGPYTGLVQFNVTMTLGGETAEFVMIANMSSGSTQIHFTHAARTSSHLGPTATRLSTWGALKSMYR